MEPHKQQLQGNRRDSTKAGGSKIMGIKFLKQAPTVVTPVLGVAVVPSTPMGCLKYLQSG